MHMRDVVGKALPVRSSNTMLLSQVGGYLRICDGEGILIEATDQDALDEIGIKVAASDVVNGRHCPARMKLAGLSASLPSNISTLIP